MKEFRKFIAAILTINMLVAAISGMSVYAETLGDTFTGEKGFYAGVSKVISANDVISGIDFTPDYKDGLVFAPISAFSYICGANISGTTIQLNGAALEFEQGSNIAYLDSAPKKIKGIPYKNGSLYVAIADVCDLFDLPYYANKRVIMLGTQSFISSVKSAEDHHISTYAEQVAEKLCAQSATATSEDLATVIARWQASAADTSGISDLATLVAGYRSKLQTGSYTSLFSDISYPEGGETAAMTETAERIYYMAKLWASTNDSSLLNDIKTSLNWFYNRRYGRKEINGTGWRDTGLHNWYDWKIGTPSKIIPTLMLVKDELTSSQITNYLYCFDQLTADASSYTGSNFLDIWKLKVGSAALKGETATISTLSKQVEKAFINVDDGRNPESQLDAARKNNGYGQVGGSGFYTDGSYVFHTLHPLNGSYGTWHVWTATEIIKLFNGTAYAIPQNCIDNMADWYVDAFDSLIYEGSIFRMVEGRTEDPSQSDIAALYILPSMIDMIDLFHGSDKAKVESIIKYYGRYCEIWRYMKDKLTDAQKARVEAIPDSVADNYDKTTSRVFYNMDKVSHKTEDWAVGISMSSKRIFNYESINNENMKGWYLGDGRTELRLKSDAKKNNTYYWKYINNYRLPGTTVDTQTRQEVSVAQGKEYLSSKNFVGGASLDDTYSTAAMRLESFHNSADDTAEGGLPKHTSNLTAYKSYFMFDNSVYCLGAKVNASNNNNANVLTIVDNYRQYADTTSTIYSGSAEANVSTSDYSFGNTSSVTLTNGDSNMGYYFPQGGNNGTLKGRWTGLDEKNGKYFELWFDHGKNPSNGTYAYALLPNSDNAATTAYAQNPDCEVLSNDEYVQAVRNNRLGITSMVFWKTGSFGDITVSNPMIVMIKEENGLKKVAVSDPTHTLGETTVKLNGEYTFNCDDKVTSSISGGETTLTIDFTDSDGATLCAEETKNLSYSNLTLADFSNLSGSALTNAGITETSNLKYVPVAYGTGKSSLKWDLAQQNVNMTFDVPDYGAYIAAYPNSVIKIRYKATENSAFSIKETNGNTLVSPATDGTWQTTAVKLASFNNVSNDEVKLTLTTDANTQGKAIYIDSIFIETGKVSKHTPQSASDETMEIVNFVNSAPANGSPASENARPGGNGTYAKYIIPAFGSRDYMIATYDTPLDLSEYNYINMWVYSPKAQGGGFQLVATNSSGSYVVHAISNLDWTGWKLVSFPIDSKYKSSLGNLKFNVNGWSKASGIAGAVEGKNITGEKMSIWHDAGAVGIESIWVSKVMPATLASSISFAKDKDILSKIGDVSKMTLNTDKTYTYNGANYSGKIDLNSQKYGTEDLTAMVTDWSGYSALNVRFYSTIAGAFYTILCKTPVKDNLYYAKITASKVGWQTVRIPLCDFTLRNSPAGWDNITAIQIRTDNNTMGGQAVGSGQTEGLQFYFDEIWLEEPTNDYIVFGENFANNENHFWSGNGNFTLDSEVTYEDAEYSLKIDGRTQKWGIEPRSTAYHGMKTDWSDYKVLKLRYYATNVGDKFRLGLSINDGTTHKYTRDIVATKVGWQTADMFLYEFKYSGNSVDTSDVTGIAIQIHESDMIGSAGTKSVVYLDKLWLEGGSNRFGFRRNDIKKVSGEDLMKASNGNEFISNNTYAGANYVAKLDMSSVKWGTDYFSPSEYGMTDDWSDYDYLCVRMKATVANKTFNIDVNNDNNHIPVTATTANEWQIVKIPITSTIKGYGKVDKIALHTHQTPGVTSGLIYYIDSMWLENAEIADNTSMSFDTDDLAALGNAGKMTVNTDNQFTYNTAVFSGKLDLNSQKWGTNALTAISGDLSDYNSLNVRFYSTVADKYFTIFVNTDGSNYYKYKITAAEGWQTVKIPYTSFTAKNTPSWESVASIQIRTDDGYDGWTVGSGTTSGWQLYFDKIWVSGKAEETAVMPEEDSSILANASDIVMADFNNESYGSEFANVYADSNISRLYERSAKSKLFGAYIISEGAFVQKSYSARSPEFTVSKNISLTNQDYINIWMYNPSVKYDQYGNYSEYVLVLRHSETDKTVSIIANWKGWKLVSIPVSAFGFREYSSENPFSIASVKITANQWTASTPEESSHEFTAEELANGYRTGNYNIWPSSFNYFNVERIWFSQGKPSNQFNVTGCEISGNNVTFTMNNNIGRVGSVSVLKKDNGVYSIESVTATSTDNSVTLSLAEYSGTAEYEVYLSDIADVYGNTLDYAKSQEIIASGVGNIILSNGGLTATVNVYGDLPQSYEDAVLIGAVYDENGAMTSIIKNSYNQSTHKFEVNVQSGTNIKYFLWKSLNSLEPLQSAR